MEIVTLFALKIDNTCFALSNTRPFYQKKPFPGGHYYELVIETNNQKDFKNLLANTNVINLDENHWDSFFMKLLGLMLRHIELEEIKYYLNTVDELTIHEKKIIIKGKCSEYIYQGEI